ncbi:single-stranded-DNA-specific exonuclease [Butyrivibrio proteoclasticus]|uniref:Single-stranded-DNA-specific exonuclease RecJ n=1 Tax=Butyrivibrio proteoclasticus TaxID=43305 RepID=A0A1I5RIQ5_9FIRM|nr:DHH family phosphoesterase [Butyrivibrio proteoclasticus]SFP58395.1 single-stranded-DNA-specific exonuclease [Butyrivibrio proteoclasticus]
MAKWMIANKKADFDGIAAKYGISNITARLIANRLINSRETEKEDCTLEKVDEYLNGSVSMLHDPFKMADMEKGARVMLSKIADGVKIRVIGDYDVDGICSSYILVDGLRLFGGDVDCVLPDRIKDGYGLSIKLVDAAIEDGIDTIITCDNGIAAFEQIKHAKEKGMTVVVTDHHEVPFEVAKGDEACADSSDIETSEKKEILPPADAVIDPKRAEGEYTFKEICGAVVAYKFLQVMAQIKASETEDAEFNELIGRFFTEKIIFAGIATVCDVMELKDENRIIVKESLKRIRFTENKGLKALIDVNSIDASAMTGYHYGFIIGPCLNATGRLDLATRALSLFFAEDEAEAATIAGDLKSLNDSRKDMTKEGVDAAIEIVDKEAKTGELPKVIVLYLPYVHESIAGIIAGKIKEKYYRPTIVLTKAADGGAKGSGRSIESYDMFQHLSACKELFTKFGGHKMAAGLSLPEENIEALRSRLNNECELTDNDYERIVHLDMVMPLKYASMSLVKEFNKLEPFGAGNIKPMFAQKDVKLLSGRILGKNKNCGKYRVSDDSNNYFDMMYFGDMDKWHEFLRDRYGQSAVDDLYDGRAYNMKVSIAYYPDINSYQGRESVQIVMSDFT